MKIEYQRNIASLDEQIQHHYTCIHELCSIRNTLVPIHRLPTEVLCRIFEIVGARNRSAKGGTGLTWHPNVMHICHHWRSTGLGLVSLWEHICPGWGVKDEQLTCYIHRAGRSQNISLVNHLVDWETILSQLEGLPNSKVTSIIAARTHSSIEFLAVCNRFQALSSIRALELRFDYRMAVDKELLASSPFFSRGNQAQLRSLLLDTRIHVEWVPIQAHFTGLCTLSAGVSITCRQDCVAFLDALGHMSALQELVIAQHPKKAVDVGALRELYEEILASAKQQTRTQPFEIELEGYGDIETRLILSSLPLTNLQFLRLEGPFFSSPKCFLRGSELLQKIVSSLGGSTKRLSLCWGYYSFGLRGFSSEVTCCEPSCSHNMTFDISGVTGEYSTSPSPPQQLQGIAGLASTLASQASTLHLPDVTPPCEALRDGTWPLLTILRSLPQISRLRVDSISACTEFLPSSGLSCIQKKTRNEEWQLKTAEWSWSQLDREELAICTVERLDTYSGDNDVETVGGWFRLRHSQVFGQAERAGLHALVGSLVPHLEVLELPGFGMDDELQFLQNCLYFRKAIGMPISRVVLPHRFQLEEYLGALQEAGVEIEVRKHVLRSESSCSDY